MKTARLVACPRCRRGGLVLGEDRRLPRHRLPWRDLSTAELEGWRSWPYCILSLHELTIEAAEAAEAAALAERAAAAVGSTG